uniref:Ubiquitinyl hydrolase 1 n=1 Tax=Brugia timori TaxID=42155 RepID=A0A0R3QHL2_9BILA
LLYHFQKTDYQFYEKFAKHFYVDNLVTSVTSSEEALALYERANKIFEEVSMQLAQWGSNEPLVRQHFDESHRLEKDETTVLGLDWNIICLPYTTLWGGLRHPSSQPEDF